MLAARREDRAGSLYSAQFSEHGPLMRGATYLIHGADFVSAPRFAHHPTFADTVRRYVAHQEAHEAVRPSSHRH